MSQGLCYLRLAALLAALLSGSVSAAATPDFGTQGDLAWDLTQFVRPVSFTKLVHPDSKKVGTRSLSVRVRIPRLDINSLLDQSTSADSRPQSGKARIELQYKRKNEAWQVDPTRAHTVIPQITSSSSSAQQGGTITRLEAVLPQENARSAMKRRRAAGPAGSNAGPRELSPYYTRKPIKFRAGDTVEYRWVMVKDDGSLSRQISRVGSFEMPPPYSIAMMGDSFGSGEGAPESYKAKMTRPSSGLHIASLRKSPIPTESEFVGDFAKWQDRQSHRSKYSGFVRGVKKFKKERPKVWVEYIHTAISGATIAPHISDENEPKAGGMYTRFIGPRELFVDPVAAATVLDYAEYDGWGIIDDVHNRQEAQLNEVERWQLAQGINCIDVALLSAGGNDAGFGKIIKKAILHSLKNNRPEVDEIVNNGFVRSMPHVEQFFTELNDYARPRYVHWATYPNLTTNNQSGHSSLTLHHQTIELGAELVAAHVAGSVIGGLIGALSSPFPLPTPDDIAAQLLATAAVLAARNVNPLVFTMSSLIGTNDLKEAENVLIGKINPMLIEWCKQQEEIDCEPIESIQDKALGHGITAGGLRSPRGDSSSSRWFNTFIDSTRHTCGGADCAVHPTRQGFKAIYEIPVYDKLNKSYVDSLKEPRECSTLPLMAELEIEWAARERKARGIARDLPDPPLRRGTPVDEQKEIYSLLNKIYGSDQSAAQEAIRAYKTALETGRMTK